MQICICIEVPVEYICRRVHQPCYHRKAKNQPFRGNSDTLLSSDSRYCLCYNILITPPVVTSFGLGNNPANKNIVIIVSFIIVLLQISNLIVLNKS